MMRLSRRHFACLNVGVVCLISLYILMTLRFGQKTHSPAVKVKMDATSNLIIGVRDPVTTPHPVTQETSEQRPKILLWTPYFGGQEIWKKVFIRLVSNECEESRCDLTFNKDEVQRADAVLFNDRDLKRVPIQTITVLNETRSPSQVFVYFNMEDPKHRDNNSLERFKNFFNWTMTYRRDSDIYIPYGTIRRKLRNSEEVPYVSEEELRKRGLAVWISSHCNTPSKRESFIRDLKQLIPLSTYGKCGNLKCGKRTLLKAVAGHDPGNDLCSSLIKSFAFFLAFENTLCTEYATEKFYRTLELGVIPVVYGGANYSTLAPPHSFIDSKDFSSIEDLVNYMKVVSQNATLYNGYLKWRESYEVEVGSPYRPFVCDLCKKLHQRDPQSRPKIYADIKEWFLQTNVTCYSYKSIFQQKRE